MLTSIFPITGYADEKSSFVDVSSSDWFYDGVVYASEHNLMNGTGDGKFSPNLQTTRGMIVTILYRLEGNPHVTGILFSDVSTNEWYSDAVAWAASEGIVDGYGNGKFDPNDPLSREQMALILYRYADYKGSNLSVNVSLEKYTDSSSISSYAIESMAWANATGLITGTDDNTLLPKNTAIRAQAAVILMRFCENVLTSLDNNILPSGIENELSNMAELNDYSIPYIINSAIKYRP